jgi:hypothetical protein
VGPNGVIFYAAGEMHGMRNIGEAPARYPVFELRPPYEDRPEAFGRQLGRR